MVSIVNFGDFGRVYSEIKFDTVNNRGTLKFKGTYDDGSMTLQLGRDPSDAGQAAVIVARDSDNDFNFMVTFGDAPPRAVGAGDHLNRYSRRRDGHRARLFGRNADQVGDHGIAADRADRGDDLLPRECDDKLVQPRGNRWRLGNRNHGHHDGRDDPNRRAVQYLDYLQG